jgi:heat shock 70kDa protein 1/2/6/8
VKSKIFSKCDSSRAKITLSNSQKFNFDIDSLFDGYDYHSTISRSRFEMISTHLLKNLMEMLDQFLGEVSVDEILLSGGTSSIPKLQSELLEHFEGKDVKQLHAYNESVIIGLCLESSFQEKRSELVFNPSDILVKNQEGNHVLLFPKDTLLPSSTSMECLTSGDLKIYQQEDLLVSIFVSKEHSKVSFHLSKEGTMKIQVNQEEEINL